MNLYHLHKGDIGFTLEWIFMCFIRIHKVKSSKYEWSLDLLTVIFDSWISISNTKGTQRFYSWKVFICFFKIYHVKSSNMNGLWISWQWSLTDESLSPTQRGIGFTLEWIFGFALISLYFDFPTLYFPYTMISLYFDFPTLISLDYDFPLHSWHSYKYGLSLDVLTEILESWSRITN